MQRVADKLLKASDMLRESQDEQTGAAADFEALVPCDSQVYPARRRAQRLSFLLWTTISQENNDLQAALETVSTTDRLRLGCTRLRELRQLVEGVEGV